MKKSTLEASPTGTLVGQLAFDPSAQKNLRIVEEAGIVEPVEGTSHPRYFRANDILTIISDAG